MQHVKHNLKYLQLKALGIPTMLLLVFWSFLPLGRMMADYDAISLFKILQSLSNRLDENTFINTFTVK